MHECSYFGGRLTKSTLPTYSGPPPQGASGAKRLLLPNGELANFYNQDDGIRYLAMLELREAAVRGNHQHKVKVEYVYVICGSLYLVASGPGDGSRVTLEVGAGERVRIEPGVAHAFKTLQPGWAVEFSPQLFDPADLEKVCLLQ